MVTLRPDLSSYNRAAYFRFLYNDVDNAVKIMKMAIAPGSPMAENTAWCEVELGKISEDRQIDDAGKAFEAALRHFPNYHPALAGLAQARAAAGDWKSRHRQHEAGAGGHAAAGLRGGALRLLHRRRADRKKPRSRRR